MNLVIQIMATEVTSPSLLAVAGMGTVFVSLTLIYLIMAGMSEYLRRMSKVVQASLLTEKKIQKEEEKESVANEKKENLKIALATSVALARHRKSKIKTLSYRTEGGINPWKLSGRINILRK